MELASKTREYREARDEAQRIAESMGAATIEEFAYNPTLVAEWMAKNPERTFPSVPADVQRTLARQVASVLVGGMMSAALELEATWAQFDDQTVSYPEG